MQDGQPAGPALASPCGFIFIFMMVNGIGPLSINFSGHLDLFIFPFFFFFFLILFKYFPIFYIEWFCFLVCFQESFMYLGWGSLFGLHIINTVSHAVASPPPPHHIMSFKVDTFNDILRNISSRVLILVVVFLFHSLILGL